MFFWVCCCFISIGSIAFNKVHSSHVKIGLVPKNWKESMGYTCLKPMWVTHYHWSTRWGTAKTCSHRVCCWFIPSESLPLDYIKMHCSKLKVGLIPKELERINGLCHPKPHTSNMTPLESDRCWFMVITYCGVDVENTLGWGKNLLPSKFVVDLFPLDPFHHTESRSLTQIQRSI